jgi:hypothetical protein
MQGCRIGTLGAARAPSTQGEIVMKRLSAVLLAAVFVIAGCAHRGPESGWITLIDGDKGLENWLF